VIDVPCLRQVVAAGRELIDDPPILNRLHVERRMQQIEIDLPFGIGLVGTGVFILGKSRRPGRPPPKAFRRTAVIEIVATPLEVTRPM
jgi:hypothetical protein